MPISDILCCAASEAKDLVESEDCYERGAWMQAKNIFGIELAQLGELLGAGTYDELFDGFEIINPPGEDFDPDEGCVFVETFPTALVGAISELTDEQIAEVAPRWARIDEFRELVPAEDLADYLRRLRDFVTSHEGAFFLVCSV